MKKLFLIIVISIQVFSCEDIKRSYTVVNSFPIDIELIATPAPEFDVNIGLYSIGEADKYIIVGKRKQDYFFTIFDRFHNKVGEICHRGDGPDDFLAPIYLNQYETIDGETKIWVLERMKRLFVLINIDKTIKEGKLVIDKQYNLANIGGMEVRNLFYINDNLLIGSTDYDECKVLFYNPNDGKMILQDNLLDFPEDVSEILSQNCMALKPDKTAFVSIFYSMPEIDIYKVSGDRYSTVFYKERLEPKMIIEKDPEIDGNYFSWSYATDNYFYVLSTDLKGEDTYDYYVLVFDWAGKPVARWKVPAADSFFVDEQAHKIYTVYYDRDGDNVMICN